MSREVGASFVNLDLVEDSSRDAVVLKRSASCVAECRPALYLSISVCLGIPFITRNM